VEGQNVKPAPERLAYTLRESATALGISVGLVRLEIKRKALCPVKLGGRVLIELVEIKRYLRAGRARTVMIEQ
jgi:hypothetical protein